MVGREEELELVLRRWSKAKTGEGQVVLLSGEPGIGKSRLTATLLERLAAEPHTRLRYFCSPQHTDSAFYPIISQMERAARLAHGDTAQTKLHKHYVCSYFGFTSTHLTAPEPGSTAYTPQPRGEANFAKTTLLRLHQCSRRSDAQTTSRLAWGWLSRERLQFLG